MNMLYVCPSIFSNRLDCMNHILFTLGNGFDWVDGQLVERGDDDSKPKNINDAILYQIEKMCITNKDIMMTYIGCGNSDRYFQRLMVNVKSVMEISHRINNMDIDKTSIEMNGDGRFMLYPLCSRSHLLNIPDDVDDDWLRFIKNALEFCKENPSRLDEGQDVFLRQVHMRVAEIEAKRFYEPEY